MGSDLFTGVGCCQSAIFRKIKINIFSEIKESIDYGLFVDEEGSSGTSNR